MSEGSQAGRIAAGVVAAIVLAALLVWLQPLWLESGSREAGRDGRKDGLSEAEPAASRADRDAGISDRAFAVVPDTRTSPARERAPAPRVGIEERGRLRVFPEELQEGEVLALGLALPDEVRGHEPVVARVIGLSGRVLDVEALPVEGTDAGLRLEIDPEWLEPGKYMVQVPTTEKQPMAVRRYVLEVQQEEAPPTEVDGAGSP